MPVAIVKARNLTPVFNTLGTPACDPGSHFQAPLQSCLQGVKQNPWEASGSTPTALVGVIRYLSLSLLFVRNADIKKVQDHETLKENFHLASPVVIILYRTVCLVIIYSKRLDQPGKSLSILLVVS